MVRGPVEIRKVPGTSIDANVGAMRAARMVLMPTRNFEPRAQQIFVMITSQVSALHPLAAFGRSLPIGSACAGQLECN